MAELIPGLLSGYYNMDRHLADTENVKADTQYRLGRLELDQQAAQAEQEAAPWRLAQEQLDYATKQQNLKKAYRDDDDDVRETVMREVAPLVKMRRAGMSEIEFQQRLAERIAANRDRYELDDDEFRGLASQSSDWWDEEIQGMQSIEDQLKPPPAPPAPQLFYEGGNAVQKQWNPATGTYDVVGQRPTFAPSQPGGGKQTKSDVELELSRLMANRTATPEQAALYYQLSGRALREGEGRRAQDAQLRADWNAEFPLNSLTGERPEGHPSLRKYREDRLREMMGVEQEGPPTVQTQADYDALPSGSTFRDPGDGKLYKKP